MKRAVPIALLQTLPSLAAGLVAFFLATARLHLWNQSPALDAVRILGFAALMAVWAWPLARRRATSRPAVLVVGMALLALFAAGPLAHHAQFPYFGWLPRLATPRHLLCSRFTWACALTLLLAALFRQTRSRAWVPWCLAAAFVAAQICGALSLWRLTSGGTMPVYSDDAPSFLFRTAEFWHSFPWRENYVPFWNGGVVNSVLTSSGLPGWALLTAPAWLFGPPHAVQPFALALAFLVLLPLLLAWALRAEGAGPAASLAGALLLLAAPRSFFLWTFHFGTLGAGVAWAALPSALLFLHAVAVRHSRSASTLLGLVLSLFFAGQWPQTWPLLALFALLALLAVLHDFDRRTFLALVGCAAVLLVLYAPALVSMVAARDLVAYTTTGGASAAARVPAAARLWDAFTSGMTDWALKAGPLLAVFGFAGFPLLPRAAPRRWLGIALLGVAALYTAGPLIAPRMQLYRMGVAFALLLIPAAALALRRLLLRREPAWAGLQGAALALLLLLAPNATPLYAGKGAAPFAAMPPWIAEFADWVRANVPENGRLLFAGRTIHAYGRGHIAYLPILAGREMLACDYYEFPPGLGETDSPPPAAARAPGGVHGWLVRHGATHAVTFSDKKLKAFRARPDLYREVASFTSPEKRTFAVFEIAGAGGVFLEGGGRVRADFNRLEIEPAPGQARIRLAYSWSDRFRVEPPAEIAPFETEDGERFLEVRPNGAQVIHVRYHPRN